MSAEPGFTSVFATALGADVDRLTPAVHRYVTSSERGGGCGSGVFTVAGSRLRWVNALARPVVGPRLMVTRYEHDVPFTVVNSPTLRADGSTELNATRTFQFADGAQSFDDVLRVDAQVAGTLRNTLGVAGRVELRLRCSVTPAGHLRMTSEAGWLRFGRFRLRLPSLLGVTAVVEDGFDESTGRQTVAATVRNPVLGTVLEYRGTFSYRITDEGPPPPPRR